MATKRVGNARLLKLAAFLRTVPRKRFDYKYWVGENWGGDPDLSCGTTACALGWATTIPSLRKAGLSLSTNGVPRLNGSIGPMGAASALFAISFDDASHLFSPENYLEYEATPKYVAKKIERFVAARSTEEEKGEHS